jgi:hypothetical protein
MAADLQSIARRHPKVVAAGAVAVVLLALYPFVAGALGARAVAGRLSARLGRPVTIGQGRGGLGRLVLRRFAVEDHEGGQGRAGSPAPLPLLSAEEISIPFGVVLGGSGPISIRGLRVNAVRGGADDNVKDLIERFATRRARAEAGKDAAPAALPGVKVESGSLSLRDFESGLSLEIGALAGTLLPSHHVSLQLQKVSGILALGGGDKGPRFGVAELDVREELTAGLHPSGYPSVRVDDGFATPLPSLSLTGIKGTVGPPPVAMGGAAQAGPRAGLVIDLHGSYGGARESLWTAKGSAHPAEREGRLALRAEQFSLDKIADVLPRSVLTPARTNIDAALDLTWAGEAVRFNGDLAVAGLSLQHDKLSSAPMEGLSLGVVLRGAAYPARRRIELEILEGRIRALVARVSGSIELPSGSSSLAEGSRRHLGLQPKIDLALNVPRLPCAKLLGSLPEALTPNLKGFVLQGFFEAQVGTKIDFSDLEALELRGKVGINGCKVLKAPPAVVALTGAEPIVQTVEVPVRPGPQAGETENIQFVIGPDNPDFVPYDQISPNLINSIMTTEDNGFFKHHGWVASEFQGALRRNLERGKFQIGASSITMQMVKNVLLSQEKTLSRKMQELFLVWYLEQVLPKERILELYFNAIEFGPRIYGIGPAARHYFGKRASELTPLEAAFFSSILPSPKRRYIQYCHGALYPPWDKYVHRIMAKVHERGRLTDEEYAAALAEPLVFDRHEATFTEKQCLDWVKKMTARPEPEPPPSDFDAGDVEAGNDGEARASSPKGHRHLRGAPKRTMAAAVANRAK